MTRDQLKKVKNKSSLVESVHASIAKGQYVLLASNDPFVIYNEEELADKVEEVMQGRNIVNHDVAYEFAIEDILYELTKQLGATYHYLLEDLNHIEDKYACKFNVQDAGNNYQYKIPSVAEYTEEVLNHVLVGDWWKTFSLYLVKRRLIIHMVSAHREATRTSIITALTEDDKPIRIKESWFSHYV